MAALSADLHVPIPQFRAMRDALHASLREDVLVVPSQYVAHWSRFHVVPSAVVRDVAYAMKRRQLSQHGGLPASTIEADAMAYAERFLRAATDYEEPES